MAHEVKGQLSLTRVSRFKHGRSGVIEATQRNCSKIVAPKSGLSKGMIQGGKWPEERERGTM